LQAGDRGFRRAGRSGLYGGRVSAWRTRLPHGQRRRDPPVPGPPQGPLLHEPAGSVRDVRGRPGGGRHRRGRLARPDSWWGGQMTEAGERGGRASEPILRDGEQPMSTGSNQEGEAPAQFSGETRETSWEALEVQAKEIIARYPQPRSALLPLLHLLQAEEGYVSPYGIEFAAEQLDLTTAEVAGVATFYTMYKRRPVGDYHVGVCTNTLCAVMGGDAIFERLKEYLDVGNDETTADGKITLEHVECNAACDYAPVMMVNWEFMDNQTPESAVEVVDDLREGRPVRSTRGPEIVTWREAERVLAGFPDDLADEGPAAGAPSLVGLGIARER